jgi:hypothetical protein
MHEERGRK